MLARACLALLLVLGLAAPALAEPVASGNVQGRYGPEEYQNIFETWQAPMALTAFKEEEKPGFIGSLKEAMAEVVKPALASWAPDARLVQVEGTSDNQGRTGTFRSTSVEDGEPVGSFFNSAWSLTYLSSGRRELLNFSIGPTVTRITRMGWEPLVLAPEAIQVDSMGAVKRLIAAIEDKRFKSEEERTGKDYFLGLPYTSALPDAERREAIYAVPKNAHWNIRLRPILGKLVWELSYAIDRPEKPGEMIHDAAIGMVDARTGTVIRFIRPFRVRAPQ